MTNHLVAGHPLPDHVAGHPALELCNTKALWGLPTEKDYLTSFAVAALWAREHSLVSAGEKRLLRTAPAAAQRAALGRLRSLRSALFHAVTADAAVTCDGPLSDVHAFVARAVSRASYDRSGRLQVAYSTNVVTDRCALAAHRLLEDYGPDAVGLCASAACGWVFLDPTHRRRWCTMAVCGNRAKVRRHAERAKRAS